MGGLLIDTLVHRFFSQTDDYDSSGTGSFDLMVRDFFEFLKDEPDKEYYLALGSNQRVKVKARFQPKARKAYNKVLEAIADEGKAAANKKWREVFGTSVPLAVSEASRAFRDTEQFIEDRYPVDITGSVAIDCEVTQNGWRPTRLREMLRTGTLVGARSEDPRRLNHIDGPVCGWSLGRRRTWKMSSRASEFKQPPRDGSVVRMVPVLSMISWPISVALHTVPRVTEERPC